MKITALDIRQKTFEKSFRGIDRDEVQAFLNTISQQWERLGDELATARVEASEGPCGGDGERIDLEVSPMLSVTSAADPAGN